MIWASRFAGLRPLASGYPLHHLRAFHASRSVATVVPLLSLSQTASPCLWNLLLLLIGNVWK
jgi:hypothetical protein